MTIINELVLDDLIIPSEVTFTVGGGLVQDPVTLNMVEGDTEKVTVHMALKRSKDAQTLATAPTAQNIVYLEGYALGEIPESVAPGERAPFVWDGEQGELELTALPQPYSPLQAELLGQKVRATFRSYRGT